MEPGENKDEIFVPLEGVELGKKLTDDFKKINFTPGTIMEAGENKLTFSIPAGGTEADKKWLDAFKRKAGLQGTLRAGPDGFSFEIPEGSDMDKLNKAWPYTLYTINECYQAMGSDYDKTVELFKTAFEQNINPVSMLPRSKE